MLTELQIENVRQHLLSAVADTGAGELSAAMYQVVRSLEFLLAALAPPAEPAPEPLDVPQDDMMYDGDAIIALDEAQNETYERVDSIACCIAMARGSGTVTCEDVLAAVARYKPDALQAQLRTASRDYGVVSAERDALTAEVAKLKDLLRRCLPHLSSCGRPECRQHTCVFVSELRAALSTPATRSEA